LDIRTSTYKSHPTRAISPFKRAPYIIRADIQRKTA